MRRREWAVWKEIDWSAVTLPGTALLADTMLAITKAIRSLVDAFDAVAASDAVKELENVVGEASHERSVTSSGDRSGGL